MAIFVASVAAGALVEARGSEAVLRAAFATGLGIAATSVVGVGLAVTEGRPVWIAVGAPSLVWMIPVHGGVPAREDRPVRCPTGRASPG